MTEREMRQQLPEDVRECEMLAGPIDGFLWPHQGQAEVIVRTPGCLELYLIVRK